MSKALVKALDRLDKANDNVAAVLERDYPVGKDVTWSRNGLFEGVVVSVSSTQVKVRSDRTGKEYWIYAYTIADATKEA